MKDPVTKFRFDEDSSDNDFYSRHGKLNRNPHRHHGTKPDNQSKHHNSRSPTRENPHKQVLSPVTEAGDRVFKKNQSGLSINSDHIPKYTDASLDHLDAERDLSPFRKGSAGEYYPEFQSNNRGLAITPIQRGGHSFYAVLSPSSQQRGGIPEQKFNPNQLFNSGYSSTPNLDHLDSTVDLSLPRFGGSHSEAYLDTVNNDLSHGHENGITNQEYGSSSTSSSTNQNNPTPLTPPSSHSRTRMLQNRSPVRGPARSHHHYENIPPVSAPRGTGYSHGYATGYSNGSYSNPDQQDHNSNLLATSPKKDIPDKHVMMSPVHAGTGEFPSVMSLIQGEIPSRGFPSNRTSNPNNTSSTPENLDVSKSGSSDQTAGNYNNSNYYNIDPSNRVSSVIDTRPHQGLKRAREQNLRNAANASRENLRYRSTSVGDAISSSPNDIAREVNRARTPSAPGELNTHQSSPGNTARKNTDDMYYFSGDNNVSNVQSPAERSYMSDLSRSVLLNRSAQSRLSRLDMDVLSSRRSIMSGEYRVREQQKSSPVLIRSQTGGDGNDLNKSVQSSHTNNYTSFTRDDTLITPGEQSLPQTGPGEHTLTHRKKITEMTTTLHQTPNGNAFPNGNAKLIPDSPPDQTSKVICSKDTANVLTHAHLLTNQDYGVINSLVSLALMSVLSLVIVFIAIQLLFHLNNRAGAGVGMLNSAGSVLTSHAYSNVLQVTIALTTFVMMLCLCCLLVCSLQCFFAAKLVKCSQGEERCFKYLKECAGTRFIAVTGFFLSIPTLIVALLLYMLLEFSSTPAIISTVILTVGLTFTVVTIIHSTYYWRTEKNKADLNIPPYGGDKNNDSSQKGDGTLSQSELSTLV